MHEFATVTSPSHDATGLATQLTDKSAQGWETVSIVATGASLTAFIRRPREGATEASSAPMAATISAVNAEPATEPVAEPATMPEWSTPAASAPMPAVEEPAGWAAAPGADDTPPSQPAPWAANPEPVSAPEPEPAAVSSMSTTESATPAASASENPSVPANWYSDPTGRFELRYWDGMQWTEHVARGGSQYLDPPVA